MIFHGDVREVAIRPALNEIFLYNTNAEELLIFTASTETDGGYRLKQDGGPACGLFQQEPITHDDLWTHTISNHSPLLATMRQIYSPGKPRPLATLMCTDLKYAACMARIFYMRVPEPLPDANDVEALARYYKTYWNTSLGDADITTAIEKYHKWIGK